MCSGGGRRVGRKGKAGKHGTQDIELSQKPRTYSHWFVDSDIGNREPWEKNELPKAIKYGKLHSTAPSTALKKVFYLCVGGFLERRPPALFQGGNELLVPRYGKINHIVTPIYQGEFSL